MDYPLIVTIALMVLVAGITVGLWARSRRARPIVGGIGLILLPLGLYFLGVTGLAINGVLSIVDWVQRISWSDTMSWGAGLAGGGLLLWVIAQFLPAGAKAPAESPQPAAEARRSQPQVTSGGKQTPQQQAQQTQGKAQAKPAQPQAKGKKGDGLSDEDREIEELLRNRGIM